MLVLGFGCLVDWIGGRISFLSHHTRLKASLSNQSSIECPGLLVFRSPALSPSAPSTPKLLQSLSLSVLSSPLLYFSIMGVSVIVVRLGSLLCPWKHSPARSRRIKWLFWLPWQLHCHAQSWLESCTASVWKEREPRRGGSLCSTGAAWFHAGLHRCPRNKMRKTGLFR